MWHNVLPGFSDHPVVPERQSLLVTELEAPGMHIEKFFQPMIQVVFYRYSSLLMIARKVSVFLATVWGLVRSQRALI